MKDLEQMKIDLDSEIANLLEEEEETEVVKERTDTNVKKAKDFPEGTTMQLDTKKYLWGVCGHHALSIPVSSWDDVYALIEEWSGLQETLEEVYADELKELYKSSRSTSRGSRRKSSAPADDRVNKLRGLIFSLGTEKGIYVKQVWPNVTGMGADELEDVLEELKTMESSAEVGAEDTTTRRRIASARRSRR